MKRWWAVAACMVMGACEPSEWKPPSLADSHEDPAKLRPGYGNEQLHTWWPMTSPEIAAVEGAERARQGDAHALFALAVMASAEKRDAESYAKYTQRFDDFIAAQHGAITSAADDAKRGDALNRAMHVAFMTGTPNKDDPKIGAYELDQPRLARVLDEGHYNCISSALLYMTLARAFSLPVRGAITETHAFIDFGPDDGARVDVETTSPTGFGELHDEKFFRDWAKGWSSSRGLKPMTIEEYSKREIVPAHVLVARSMHDKRVVNDDNRGRLYEASAILAPDDHESVHNRLVAYANEAKWLYEHKASRTTVRMLDIVGSFVSDVPNRFPNDTKLLSDVAWLAWYDANALVIVGRGDEAVAIADEFLDRIKPTWEEAELLHRDFVNVILDRLTELQVAHAYEKSVAIATKHIADCHANAACLNNLYLTFDAWCVHYQEAKDWPNAKKVMRECIALFPDDTRCHHTLEGLTSLHP